MNSFYGQYIKELIGREILEDSHGFATYEIVDAGYGCYITDIFVAPKSRNQDIGLNYVNKIYEIAKESGCKYLLGTCIPTNNKSTRSTAAMIKWGFEVHSSEDNKIWFRKGIK